tara:strand:- start:161 stop:637 length:477 start_codon:yes stop_codon:yes gene_type:complete
MSKVPMTVVGVERLRSELKKLKTIERPKNSKAIAEAREHGDLKENAEYHAAREQQSFCEGRISEIEAKLSESEIIDISKIDPVGKVLFGTTVTLYNLDTEESVNYQIVGEDEADVSVGKISVISPLARAVMGKPEGEEVVVKVPAGDVQYEIEKIEHI